MVTEGHIDPRLSKLVDRWPGRAEQVSQLHAFVGDVKDVPPPLLLYGGPSTGKTSVIRFVTLLRERKSVLGMYCLSIKKDT
jgi:Cdc6-like AAA superfamily ATPase